MSITKDEIAVSFFKIVAQFLETCTTTWPHESLIPLAISQIQLLSPDECLTSFLSAFGPFLDRLANKDFLAVQELSELPVLQGLSVHEKFMDLDEAKKELMWNYITNMCRLVTMNKLYSHIPSNVLGAVSEAAATLRAQIDDGTMNATNINPFELGQQVMAKFNHDEIEGIMTNLMKNQDIMNSVMSQMTGILGTSGLQNAIQSMDAKSGLPEGLSDLLKGSGDMSSLFKMLEK